MPADVLVVGAGSAGCVVAERLSRNAERSVVVVEAGPSVPRTDGSRRLDRLDLGSPAAPARYARWYAASPPVVRGRAVGGSSAINGGYFLRARPDDFAGWGGPFTPAAVAAAYSEVEAAMSATALPDEEVPAVVRALEHRWAPAPAGPWPGIGARRVPVNRLDGRRRSAADAYLEPVRGRTNLVVRPDAQAQGLVVERGRAVGVRLADGSEIRAGEVVLCGGTLGTAAVLLGSGVVVGPLPVYEHREVLVRYRPRRPAGPAPVLLPSVIHTADAEIRCYADDFARFIPGLTASTPAVGVAEMVPRRAGAITWDGARLALRLAPIGPVDDAVAAVVRALSSSAMAEYVVAGSVRVDPVVGTSQHAWGALAMGERTDWLGAVDGVAGLRVIDGSILPNISSGPHATIMMAAHLIGSALG